MLLVTIDTKIKIIYNKAILEKATYVGGKMLGTLNLDAVNSFLNTCRKEIKKGNHYFVGYRKININGKKISAKQALIDIGIMKEKDIISIFLSILFFFIYCIRKAKIAMVINIKNIL